MKMRYYMMLGAASLCYNGVAVAQDSEIIVTANKREESLNKVGATITAFSGEALAERRIVELEDIARSVPGLVYSLSTTNTPVFTLRGIGFNESSLGVYPAVSAYVDQVPLPFPVLTGHAAFDLERVEVLKGPQGTLFGQNSTGGAINFIAAKPTDTWQAGGTVGYGRFNTIQGDAFISGPISESLGVRVAATGLNSDDWQKSYTRRDTNGHQSYVAGRMLLEFQPSDSATLLLNVNGWIDKSQPQAQQLIAAHEQFPDPNNALRHFISPPLNGAVSRLMGYPFIPKNNSRLADWSTRSLDPATTPSGPDGAPLDPSQIGYSDLDPFMDRKFWQVSLRGDIELTSGITLTSITSYLDFDQKGAIDGDGIDSSINDLPVLDGTITSFSQELRLANDPASSFRWIVGATYEDSETFENQLVRYFQNSSYRAANLYINGGYAALEQKIESYAFFGGAEFSVTPELTVKASGRYTNTTIKANTCAFSGENMNLDKLFTFLGSLNFGGLNPPPPLVVLQPGDCYAFNDVFQPGDLFVDKLKEDNVSWKFGVDYQVTPETLLYANVSRGYKAGSYPNLPAASFAALRPVSQESVTAYEAGLKTQFLDRKVALTAAAFYYDYKDKQVRGRFLDTPNIFGPLEALVNVPKSRVYGAEAELTVRPVAGLTLSGAVTYLNSRIKEYVGYDIFGGFDNGGTQESFKGDRLPFTPKWSGSLNMDYRHEMANGGGAFIGATYNWQSSSEGAIGGARTGVPTYPDLAALGLTSRVLPGLTTPYLLKAYQTLDLRAGYEAPDEAWKVMVWGKNVLNEFYWTGVNPSTDSTSRLTGRPATYGITFGFKFK